MEDRVHYLWYMGITEQREANDIRNKQHYRKIYDERVAEMVCNLIISP